MVTCYPSYDMTPPLPSPAQCGAASAGVGVGPVGGPGSGPVGGKDYSRPLHVDCSVEYELPDAAKPPAGQRSEPLLMIHPCYYRRAEAQRRTRFVNNLPKSLSSPVTTSSSSSSSSGRRSKVARLSSEPSWPQPKPVSLPVYPACAPTAMTTGMTMPSSAALSSLSSCYKVGATADFSTASWPGRTPAAPSSAKLDAGAVLSDIIASTCSELNNNNNSSSNNNNSSTYMKQQQSQQQSSSSSHSQTSSTSGSTAGSTSQLFERQLGGSCASYQQLPGYHDSLGCSLGSLGCKACQYPQHHSNQQHPGSQAAQANRLYGGGLVKAVEPNPEMATNPVPAKVRRCGVKRSRSSRGTAAPDCARATPRATPSWSDAMLHAAGFSFEGAGVWYGHQGTPQHHAQHHAPVAGVAAPVPGATAADPLGAPLAPLGSVAWGAMFPHCREREDDSRVLWNSDSLLRLVPV
ncbi:uncharacterized protein LOC117640513 [Thrips palmi]|uniref:Uncharacterized protein LOC117640513 n=1 Tax=Thrips palmi TaxID=161013 RepID=A0A6P8Y8F1_THRPL|nr:uncharacterized protein LOC117640513 [Thrips palmi]